MCGPRVIAEHTDGLDPELRREIEWQVLAGAAEHTPGRLGRDVAAAAIAIDPDLADRRADAARARRGVKLRGLTDDLARLSADLPANKAAVAYGVLDQLAESIADGAAEGRGISQIRADVFSDLFTALAETGHIDLRGYPVDDGAPGPQDDHTNETPDDSDDPTPDDVADYSALTAPNTRALPSSTPEPPNSDGSEPALNTTSPGASTPETPEFEDSGPALEPRKSDSAAPPAPAPQPAPSSPTAWTPISSHVDVTIAMSTLAGLDDLPAQLTGHGAITAGLARALAAAWKSVRLIVIGDDPPGGRQQHGVTSRPGACHDGCAGVAGCGTAVDYGRTVYRPPAAVAELVRARDRTCRFPGCGMRAERCDLDHREPFHPGTAGGGPTCPCNLDCLCRYHHRVKTFTGWQATRDGNELRWISPSGRGYADPAPDIPLGKPFTVGNLARSGREHDPAPF